MDEWNAGTDAVQHEEVLAESATATGRGAILDEASGLVHGDRNRDYGEPVANMEHISRIFYAWEGVYLTPAQVTSLMMCVKLARMTTSRTHKDSYVDLCGYAGIKWECET